MLQRSGGGDGRARMGMPETRYFVYFFYGSPKYMPV